MLLINPYRFAAPEVPQTVSGLQLWLDATTGLYDATSGGSVVTADSAAVARWEDRSGFGRHATQATENNRPILKTSQLNGKNIISFDGVNDSLSITTSALLRNVSGYTIFAIRKNRSSVTVSSKVLFVNGSTLKFELNTTATNSIQARCRRLTTDTIATFSAGANTTTANSFQLFCAQVDHLNTTIKVFRNGSQIASNSAFMTSGNSSDVSNVSVLCANAARTGQWADTDIAELLIYHGALSDTDRGTIESYLTTKWGL